MKTLKMIMLLTGILAFGFGIFNIIISGLPNQWFGFISGALLIWMFFNIDKINKPKKINSQNNEQ